MKLGLLLGYSGKRIEIPLDLIKQAEALGYDSVWTAESYGNDAVTSATWILAHTDKIRVGTSIMQMPSRTPALAAMTAMSLDQLSGGRFIAGIGASGPQVVEGWHGIPYGKPVTRTREYIEIMRQIMARQGPLDFQGEVYQVPNKGPGTTGLGKPLKSILDPSPDIPIYTASITPAGLRCAGELADGVFPVWMDPNQYGVIGEHLEKGFAAAGNGKSLANFDVAPFVFVAMNDDVRAGYDALRPGLALYIGGMGAKGKNFYHDYTARLGFADAAEEIQDLYLAGKHAEAIAAVPDEFVDAIGLVGPRERIREKLADWKAAAARGEISTMLLGMQAPSVLEFLAGELL
ncbi:LLM class F420-dependent oxidoreductase [Haliea sp. E17]|uniref:LLM class F420-dependent oxidoreductase n=1 Tax=Haliea sp. E17 TaxID=3401576 RepID=UPI003AACF0B7